MKARRTNADIVRDYFWLIGFLHYSQKQGKKINVLVKSGSRKSVLGGK